MNPDFCQISESIVKLMPVGLEKHSREGYEASPITLKAFTEDPRIDPVYYVKAYVKATKRLRNSDKLFVSTQAPHSDVNVATLSRWIAQVITQSGQQGTGGSVRSTSASYAMAGGAGLETILGAGDWARARTFQKFYYKPVPLNFQESVIKI